MAPSTPQHLAFFGATGGCALNALVHSLNAGHICTALARTPSKLTGLLEATSTPTENLTIVSGSIDDRAAVASTLQNATTVIFGVGGSPVFSPNPLTMFVTLNDQNICERAITQVLSVLQETGSKPLISVISSTGLHGNKDLPILMRPLYKALEVPHRDKEAMERLVVKAAQDGVVDGHVIVRPALLSHGSETEGKVKAGYEGRFKNGSAKWGDIAGEAVGYTISRKDVGRWIFEEVVEGRGGEWKGHGVSLAY
jgi:putative NADH-flavin reductase